MGVPKSISRNLFDGCPEIADVNWRLTTVNGADVINNITVAAQSNEVIVATIIPVATTSAATLTFDTGAATLTLDEM